MAFAPTTPRDPDATVVVPTYNRADLIGQALDSLASQTWQNFEVLVVDDGSSDDTAVIVGRHPLPVRYIRTEHLGPAAARNAGMAQASGRYIAYLDSDDLYYRYKLGLQIAWLDRHPQVGMVYTDFSAFDDNGFWDERHLTKYHQSGYRDGRNRYDRLFPSTEMLLQPGEAGDFSIPTPWVDARAYHGSIYDTSLRDTVIFTNSMMFRRALLSRTGLQSPRFGHFHDLEFALRLCKEAPVGFLDLPTYKLRYHPGQVTTHVGSRAQRIALEKQQDLLRMVRVHAASDPDYYVARRQDIDATLARLARAAAVPLMAYGGGTRHQSVYYPRRARAYLRYAARHGARFRTLTALTYAPEWVRRVYFGIAARRPRRTRRSSSPP
jgi:GT2 family glycosyltransferase